MKELPELKQELRNCIKQARTQRTKAIRDSGEADLQAYVEVHADDLERLLNEIRWRVKRACPDLLKAAELVLDSVARVNGRVVTDISFEAAIKATELAVLQAKL